MPAKLLGLFSSNRFVSQNHSVVTRTTPSAWQVSYWSRPGRDPASRIRPPTWQAFLFSVVTLTLTLAPAHAAFWDASEEYGFSGDGKAAFGDFNGDGWVDVYAGGKLFRNEKGKAFTDVTGEAGLAGGEGIWGDYDNDGDLDLFTWNGQGTLYRNNRRGSFDAVPFPPLPTVAARGGVWADLNNDGYLDLYVGGYEEWQKAVHPDALFLNKGRGQAFEEYWRSPEGACYSTRGVASADFDEDGDTDIYLSHYRLQPNFLYRNDGNADLKEVGVAYGVAGIPDAVINYTGGIRYPICGHSIGSAFGDLDQDGHLDLLVGNFSHPAGNQDRPQFLRNLGPAGDYKFEDKSAGAGLAWQESFASASLADYDNDGDLDLYYTTVYGVGSGGIHNYPVLYRNEGNWKFVDVTKQEELHEIAPTYQAAWADIDNDGDLDLVTAGKLFLNTGRNNHWLNLRFEGDGRDVNRSAIGVQVRIKIGDQVVTREIEGGTGEGNQNDLRLHFGLGAHPGPVDLEIALPGGKKKQIKNVTIDRQHNFKYKPAPDVK